MPGAPFWIGGQSSQAYAWDIFQVILPGGVPVPFPGIAKVRVVLSADIHKGKAQGTDSPSVTDRGLKPRKVFVELTLYTSEQWSQFQQYLSLLGYSSAGVPRGAMQLDHPAASAAGVGTVVMEKIEIPAPNAKDAMVVKMEFTELKPPKPTVTLPAGKLFSQVGLTPIPGSNGT